MLGELDPFKMAEKLPRRAFIWWMARRELKLSELHEKWEYYAAAIRGDIRGVMSGECPSIESMLLKMGLAETPEEQADTQQRENEMFMGAIASLDKRLNR